MSSKAGKDGSRNCGKSCRVVLEACLDNESYLTCEDRHSECLNHCRGSMRQNIRGSTCMISQRETVTIELPHV